MRTPCCVLTMLILAGCAWQETGSISPASMSAADQYKAAQKSFQKKLEASHGLTLARLQSQWGEVRQSLTRNQSTIYHWVQTISVTAPPEAAAKVGLEAATNEPVSISCLAFFIFNRNGVVDEASSEGQCLDHTLMPSWRPKLESTGAERPNI